jgi:hypothetical protein
MLALEDCGAGGAVVPVAATAAGSMYWVRVAKMWSGTPSR